MCDCAIVMSKDIATCFVSNKDVKQKKSEQNTCLCVCYCFFRAADYKKFI